MAPPFHRCPTGIRPKQLPPGQLESVGRGGRGGSCAGLERTGGCSHALGAVFVFFEADASCQTQPLPSNSCTTVSLTPSPGHGAVMPHDLRGRAASADPGNPVLDAGHQGEWIGQMAADAEHALAYPWDEEGACPTPAPRAKRQRRSERPLASNRLGSHRGPPPSWRSTSPSTRSRSGLSFQSSRLR